jgi:hypothetical protein
VLRIRDVYPGSLFLPIPDPGPKTATKERGEKKLVVIAINWKIENYLSFEMLKKKIWANFQRIIELFTQKLSLSSQKYGFGIRDPEKTYPYHGSRIQGPKRHQIPDPQHCLQYRSLLHIISNRGGIKNWRLHRHTAGLTWAFNTRPFFQQYFPDFDLGEWQHCYVDSDAGFLLDPDPFQDFYKLEYSTVSVDPDPTN